jgi:CRP-like cAMP-binding protein
MSQEGSNCLIALMPPDIRAHLAPHLEIVSLSPRAVLAKQGEPHRYAYFPHGGAISLVSGSRSDSVETVTVGAEGFIGFEALLGNPVAAQTAIVKLAGAASRLPIATLNSVAWTSESVRGLLLAYIRCILIQALHLAACNARHSAAERYARCLLIAHDAAGADTFVMTQSFAADLLGMQRPTVTMAAQTLQIAALIQYKRGQITIVDRAGLERASCECYRLVGIDPVWWTP